jgi:hypothetical protein
MKINKLKGPLWLALAGLSLCFPSQSWAWVASYFPLSHSAIKQPFKAQWQGVLRAEPLLKTLPAGAGGIQVSLTDEQHFRLQGQDKNKQPFVIFLEQKDYSVYTSDLDKNGFTDLILIAETRGNGMAPSSHLISFLFDAQGRPFPFTAEGYFQYDQKGIADLLDLNHDGKAELVYMNYDQGYWVTQLYKAKDARWERVEGRFGAHTYPLYTRFTSRANRVLIKPTSPQKPYSAQLSNLKPILSGQLASLKWADVQQSEDIQLTLGLEQGKKVVCKPVSWFSTFTVLVDNAQGREIAALSEPAASKRLLERVLSGKYKVNLFGERDSKVCSPELLWATELATKINQ